MQQFWHGGYLCTTDHIVPVCALTLPAVAYTIILDWLGQTWVMMKGETMQLSSLPSRAALVVILAAASFAAAQPITEKEAADAIARFADAINAHDAEALRKVTSDKNLIEDMLADFRKDAERGRETRVEISIRESAVTPDGFLAACVCHWSTTEKGRTRSKDQPTRIAFARTEQGVQIVKLESEGNILMRQASLLGRRLEQAVAKKDFAELALVLNLSKEEAPTLQSGDASAAKAQGVAWLLDALSGRATLKNTTRSERRNDSAVTSFTLTSGDATTTIELTVKMRPGKLGEESFYLDFARAADGKK